MWKFVKSASNMESWLEGHTKEICFIGRSNVGKSSLINAITNNQGLARVSNTPGRTQLINFFQENDKFLVDLPGYGYAKMSKDKKSLMITMIEDYFQFRKQIIKVFLLIDAKVGPTNDDLLMLEFLESLKLPIIAIITKSDKANQSAIAKSTKLIENFVVDFIITSTRKGTNIAHLRKVIDAQFQ